MRASWLLVLVLLLAGCVAEEPATVERAADISTDDASLRPIEQAFEGVATGTPAAPDVHEFAFEVPSGAVGVNGTLTWDAPAARIRVELIDPRGDVVAKSWQESDTRASLATEEPPRPGTWTFRVVATLAANAPFELVGRAELLVPQNNTLRETMELGPASFYEINMVMEENATLTFLFESSSAIRWDIHSHPEGGVKVWREGTGTSANETFTAPARATYSILFENLSPVPTDLRFEVVGAFRMHSHCG